MKAKKAGKEELPKVAKKTPIRDLAPSNEQSTKVRGGVRKTDEPETIP